MTDAADLPTADILDAAGLTTAEAVAFLAASGFDASEGAVRAWRRGVYRCPPAASAALLGLLRLVVAGDASNLPDDAPDGARRRCLVHGALR